MRSREMRLKQRELGQAARKRPERWISVAGGLPLRCSTTLAHGRAAAARRLQWAGGRIGPGEYRAAG